eukprot:GILK01006903.1.p1 GENE.GILK01006903.1~~GILK01006903.1.p1  ORF type:complete len:362 (+),score=63.07 GILK01006903.1:15-1100(+)
MNMSEGGRRREGQDGGGALGVEEYEALYASITETHKKQRHDGKQLAEQLLAFPNQAPTQSAGSSERISAALLDSQHRSAHASMNSPSIAPEASEERTPRRLSTSLSAMQSIQDTANIQTDLLDVTDRDADKLDSALVEIVGLLRDTVSSQFHSVKRACIQRQTQELASLEERHALALAETLQEADDYRTQVRTLTRQVQHLTGVTSNMSKWLFRRSLLSNTFRLWRKRSHFTADTRNMSCGMIRVRTKLVLNRCLSSWRLLTLQMKQKRMVSSWKDQLNQTATELSQTYEAELSRLRTALQHAEAENRRHVSEQLQLRESFRRAVLRGISTLNIEAVSALGAHAPFPHSDPFDEDQLNLQT